MQKPWRGNVLHVLETAKRPGRLQRDEQARWRSKAQEVSLCGAMQRLGGHGRDFALSSKSHGKPLEGGQYCDLTSIL